MTAPEISCVIPAYENPDRLAARNPPAISRSARWMLKAAMALRS